MVTTHWPSPAKLNLFLYITGRRKNGYHDLQTLFHFLDYSDRISIRINTSGDINIHSQMQSITLEENLIYRAAKALQEYTQCPLGAHIDIHKILPIGGGLGGGSSNAATTLVALNHLWKTNLTKHALAQIAVKLGADVPVFVRGKTAFAEGIGEKLQETKVPEKWYLVIRPDIHISTAKVFAHPHLTRNTPKRPLNALLSTKYENDCEKIVRDCFPEVDKAISWLLQYAPSQLTGTGACIFAAFESEAAACLILKNLPDWLTGFVARGMNVSPLISELHRQKN